MSLTTFADLVTEAERTLTELVTRRALDHRRLAATWPLFRHRAVHAITAAAGARPARWYAEAQLVAEASKPRNGRPTSTRNLDPTLLRAAQLLGAAGDLLACAPRERVGEPVLEDEAIRAAQSRVAGLLAAGAHLVSRAVAEAQESGQPVKGSDVRVGHNAAFVEQLAVSVMRQSPASSGRADDVAAVFNASPVALEDVVEMWARQAGDTLGSLHPSARDLQGLTADLAQVCGHSRAIVRAAVETRHLAPAEGRAMDAALGRATIGWLDAAKAWDRLHTADPATPEKIALSHAMARALAAVTRDGKEWATPREVATRIDVDRGLRVVRRGQDVAHQVSARLPSLTVNMADSGVLFVPARLAAPTLDNLKARQQHRLLPADRRQVAALHGVRAIAP